MSFYCELVLPFYFLKWNCYFSVCHWKFAKFILSFQKAQVSFPSNFASIFSTIKHKSSIYFLATTLYTLVKSSLLKYKFLKFLSAQVKICYIPHVNFELTSNFFSNFASLCIVITRNSPVRFKVTHFLFCIKGPNEIPNFETFMCSGENLPNSSCNFPINKSVFLQILHDSAVSWNVIPLYFFRLKIIYFAQKWRIKV